MNWPKKVLKSIAIALSFTLFTTNVLLAHTPAAGVWAERKKNAMLAQLPDRLPTTLPPIARPTASLSHQIKREIPKSHESKFTTLIQALPHELGTVRRVSIPPNATSTVIQIQDVHMNSEAQYNIGQTVEALINQKKVDLIALEGAFGPTDFSIYHNFPYQNSVKAVADYLLDENKISGPVHTLFLNKSDVPTVGIDHKRHYDANVEAYKTSARAINARKSELVEEIQNLTQEKIKVFGPDLKQFDARVQAYRDGQMSWGDYVRTLVQYRNDTTHEIDVFVEALNQEAALNFPRVEQERAQLLTQLIAKLSEKESADLLNHSAAYRTGALSHTNFYAYIKDLCATHGVALSQFKAMDNYIRYVLLSDAINVEKVLRDISALEKSTYGSLAKTSEEKELVRNDRSLALTKKLLDFSLTKDEWLEYQKRGGDYASFEAFYERAIARDTAMTNNLLKAVDDSKASVTVLVTGGFHTQGMMEQLNKKGIATITFAPKISKVEDENGTGYLSVFTQEKTPLDRLFAGEKLFVPPPVNTAPAATTGLMQAHHTAVATNQNEGSARSAGIEYTVRLNPVTKVIVSASAAVAAMVDSWKRLLGFSLRNMAALPALILTAALAGCVSSLQEFNRGRIVPFANALSDESKNQIISQLEVEPDFSDALLKEKELEIRLSSDSIFKDDAPQAVSIVFIGENNRILFQQQLTRSDGEWIKSDKSDHLAASDQSGAFFSIPTSLLQGRRVTKIETRLDLSPGYELKRAKSVHVHPKTNFRTVTLGPIPLNVGIFSLDIPLQIPKNAGRRPLFHTFQKAGRSFLVVALAFLASCVSALEDFNRGRSVPLSNAMSVETPDQIVSTLDIDSEFSDALLGQNEIEIRASSPSIFKDKAAQRMTVFVYGAENQILFQHDLIQDGHAAYYSIPSTAFAGSRITRFVTKMDLKPGYKPKTKDTVVTHPKTNLRSVIKGPIPLEVGIFSLDIPLQIPTPVKTRPTFRHFHKGPIAIFIAALLGWTTDATAAAPTTSPIVFTQQDPVAQNIAIALNEEYGGGPGETWKGRWSNVTPEQADAITKASSLKFTVAPPALDELTGFHIQIDGGSAFGFRMFVKKVEGQWGVYSQGKTPDLKTGAKITVEGNYVVVVIPISEISGANPVSKIHVHSGQEQNGVKLNAQNVRPDVVVEIIPKKANDPAPVVQPMPQENKTAPRYPSVAPTKPQNEIVSVVRNEQGVWLNVKGELWSGAPGVAYQPTPNNQHITAFQHGRMALLYRALLPPKDQWSSAEKTQYPELWNLVEKEDAAAAAPQDHARMIADFGFKFIRTYNLAATDEADLTLVSKIFQWMNDKYDLRFVAGLYDPAKGDIEKVVRVLKNNQALLHYDGWNEIDLRGGTAETIQNIDDLAGHLKNLDPNHPVTLVVTQNITPDLAAVVRDTKNIDIVGLTIYDRPGYDASKFMAAMQGYFSPKAVIVSEYGVRSDKHTPAERAAMLEEFQRNMTMTRPGQPTATPLHVQFYWKQESWKGDDRFWELIDENNRPTQALEELGKVNRKWVLAKKPAPQPERSTEPKKETEPKAVKPEALEKSAGFSIDLNESYGGKESDSHYGRFKKLSSAESQNFLGETHIRITIDVKNIEDLTGFHVDLKNKTGFTGYSLYGKRGSDGNWSAVNKDGSPNTLSGAKMTIDGNRLIVTIPRADIKLDVVSQVHVQTGKEQNRVSLNKTNIETDVRVEAVTVSSNSPKKSGFAFFLLPLGADPLGSDLSVPIIAAAILSAIALTSYVVYRFNQWNKKRIAFNNLVYAIRSTVRNENLQEKTAAEVLMNISARMPDQSFHLAHGLQLKHPADPAANLRKHFAVGLGLAAQSGGFTGKRVSNLQKEMTNAWKTHRELATVIHIGRADDLHRLEEVLTGTQIFNKTRSANRGVAVVLNAELGEAGLRERADQIISRFTSAIPIAFIDEKSIPQVEGQGIPYTVLFEELKKVFENSGHSIIAHTYDRLAQEKTSGVRLLIVGTPVTAYTASEKLLEIMICMVPIQNGTLLIDIGVVLLAAKQA